MKRLVILILIIVGLLIMVDVTSDGQERIQSNDGTTKIGITEREVKLTKPETEALDATNEDLILNDEQNVFKIVATGTVELPFAAAGTIASITVTHSLGYVPAVIAYFDQGSSKSQLPIIETEVSGVNAGKVVRIINCNVTSTIVQFDHRVVLYGFSGDTIKYYLLQETAD